MRLIICAFFVMVCAEAFAQTTFILVRHAEKEGTGKDPVLTKEGEERSRALVQLFDKQKIDAIMSTNFNRTRNTVEPIAKAKGINTQIYGSMNEPDVVKLIDAGGTVLICGHSNTIPALANLLLGKNQFANYEDSDYGNILIITTSAIGKATVTHLKY